MIGKRNIFRVNLVFICVFVFFVGVVVGYLWPGFSSGNPVRILNLVRLAMDSILSLNGFEVKIITLFFYYLFLLFILYIFSLAFGLGALFFIFSRGIFSGIVISMTRETPVSFFLVSPFGVAENLLLIAAGSIGLNLGRQVFNLLRGKAVNKKYFILSAQVLALMVPFFIAAHLIDSFIVSLIFGL